MNKKKLEFDGIIQKEISFYVRKKNNKFKLNIKIILIQFFTIFLKINTIENQIQLHEKLLIQEFIAHIFNYFTFDYYIKLNENQNNILAKKFITTNNRNIKVFPYMIAN